ncbi:hypothetical protein [Streptomyces sp. NPDC026673]|uniref:hypothetical protein n=1 Tax=Streptomyces sp. NPDC026673 TaxID=3155724 RepID=UPI0033FE279F
MLNNERMASHLAGVFFTVHIEGIWRGPHTDSLGHPDPVVVARHHLRRQTAQILSRHSVLNPASSQDAANTVLMQWNQAALGLEVTGVVHLTVPRQDRNHAEEHARRHQASETAYEDERQRLVHLQRLLADPELRLVWWADRFPERLPNLDELTAALQGLSMPHHSSESDDLRGDIGRFINQLFAALHTPQQREVFLRALVQTLHALGHHDLKTAATQWHRPHEPGSTPT